MSGFTPLFANGPSESLASVRAHGGTGLLVTVPAHISTGPHKLVEEALPKAKALLRSAGARTRQDLTEAIGWVLDAVPAWYARGFFEHCGYRLL